MGDRRAWVKHILYELHRPRHGHKWFNITLSRYENFFGRANLTLGLQALQLCPHVVRHSSASNDSFHKRRTLKEIKKRGRWAADMSVARYEKEGMLLQALKRVTPKQAKAMRLAAGVLPGNLLKALRALRSDDQ